MLLRLSAIIFLLVSLLGVAAACGGDDEGDAPGPADENGESSSSDGGADGDGNTMDGASGGNGDGDEGEASDNGGSLEDDPDNPWVLAYRFTGEEGTLFAIEQDIETGSGGQSLGEELTVDAQAADEGFWAVYTPFVEAVSVDVSVTSDGGSVTFDLVLARFDPPGSSEVEFGEVLDSVTVAAGETATVQGSLE